MEKEAQSVEKYGNDITWLLQLIRGPSATVGNIRTDEEMRILIRCVFLYICGMVYINRIPI